MAALHRAVALEQVHQVAVLVAQDLHLDVLGADHQLFDEDRIVTERLAGLGLGARQRSSSSAAARTTRIPRPPPPPAALTNTG